MSLPMQRLVEAVERAKKEAKPRRFKQSYEVIIKLKDVDVKKPESRIMMNVKLPHPPADKLAKVCVIATGDLALKAKEVADLVIDRDELQKIAGSKKEAKKLAKSYDFFVAQADLMPMIGRLLGRYLGPRGKMPTPVPPNVDIKAVVDRLRGSVRVRIKDQPVVMCRVGSEDQSPEEVAKNITEVLNAILSRFKPYNIDRVYVKLTMGPAVKVER